MAGNQATSNGGSGRTPRSEARTFRFDVLVDGAPVRRDVSVACLPAGIEVEGEPLDLDSVFWVSRRAGLVLLFTREKTLAFLGRSGDLEELARTVERHSDRAAQRSLLQPLAAEVVVCTAGTAVSGTIGGVPIKGLHLAVFTQTCFRVHTHMRSRRIDQN